MKKILKIQVEEQGAVSPIAHYEDLLGSGHATLYARFTDGALFIEFNFSPFSMELNAPAKNGFFSITKKEAEEFIDEYFKDENFTPEGLSWILVNLTRE